MNRCLITILVLTLICNLSLASNENDSLSIIALKEQVRKLETKSIILENKIEIYSSVNNKILNTARWITVLIAALMVGLGVINYFTNISKNKGEIDQIRNQLIKEVETIKNNISNDVKTELGKIPETVTYKVNSKNDYLSRQIDGVRAMLLETRNKLLLSELSKIPEEYQINSLIEVIENTRQIENLDPHFNFANSRNILDRIDDLKKVVVRCKPNSNQINKINNIVNKLDSEYAPHLESILKD